MSTPDNEKSSAPLDPEEESIRRARLDEALKEVVREMHEEMKESIPRQFTQAEPSITPTGIRQSLTPGEFQTEQKSSVPPDPAGASTRLVPLEVILHEAIAEFRESAPYHIGQGGPSSLSQIHESPTSPPEQSEPAVFRYTSSVPAEKLYDFGSDPKNLRPKENLIRENFNPFSAYEKAIKDTGYVGYWFYHPELGMIATVFEELPVERIERVG